MRKSNQIDITKVEMREPVIEGDREQLIQILARMVVHAYKTEQAMLQSAPEQQQKKAA